MPSGPILGSQSQQGMGGAGWVWSLGVRSGGSSCWHHGVLDPVPDTSAHGLPCPLSTRRQSLGASPLAEEGAVPT